MIGVPDHWLFRALRVSGGALLLAVLVSGHGLAQDASLDLPARVAPGGEFAVQWRGPDAPGDFIAIAEPTAPASGFVAYARTGKGNPATLTAPPGGDYEVRYVAAAGLTVLARAPLRIGAEGAEIAAPRQAEAGASVTVSVATPGDPADYLTIVAPQAPDDAFGPYARLRGAREVALAVPEAAGSYEIRLVRAKDQSVLARAPLTVVAAAAQPALSGSAQPPAPAAETAPAVPPAVTSPATSPGPAVTLMALAAVDRARGFHVAWTGPGAAGDRIEIAPAQAGAAALAGRDAAAGGSPLGFTAPAAPGAYSIRYVAGADGAVLAERALEVR